MGDKPRFVMPVGVDSYETHSCKTNINIYDLITRTRAFISSLSRFVKTCLSTHAGRTQKKNSRIAERTNSMEKTHLLLWIRGRSD